MKNTQINTITTAFKNILLKLLSIIILLFSQGAELAGQDGAWCFREIENQYDAFEGEFVSEVRVQGGFERVLQDTEVYVIKGCHLGFPTGYWDMGTGEAVIFAVRQRKYFIPQIPPNPPGAPQLIATRNLVGTPSSLPCLGESDACPGGPRPPLPPLQPVE